MFNDNFISLKLNTTGAEINLAHGGKGNPLLLLHGYPQTHVIWHAVAPALAKQFHVICPDLRGYGDSSKPVSSNSFEHYSKREMAKDMVEVMEELGYDSFYVAGHDRGARVIHRMARDYPNKVLKACVMDIVPTEYMYGNADKAFASGYYHWFFLIQPDGLPEKMISEDPEYYLREKLKRWSAANAIFDEQAVAEYIRCFSHPETIHATCNDYRAAASIDLEHDAKDKEKLITCPLIVLWGSKGFINRTYDVLDVWSKYALQVHGKALDCGHFVPEEAAEDVIAELLSFFS